MADLICRSIYFYVYSYHKIELSDDKTAAAFFILLIIYCGYYQNIRFDIIIFCSKEGIMEPRLFN